MGVGYKVIQPFTAGGQSYVLGDVIAPTIVVGWPDDSLANRIKHGYLVAVPVADGQEVSPSQVVEEDKAAADADVAALGEAETKIEF